MKMVKKVGTKSHHFQHQLSIIGVGVPVLPHALMVHVPEMNDVPAADKDHDVKLSSSPRMRLASFDT